jgi:hypothetical protein
MRRSTAAQFWGWLLIAGGALLLAVNLDLLGPAELLVAPLLFGAGSLAFLVWWARDTRAWWAAIPGCALGGLAVLTSLDIAGSSGQPWQGSIFLGALSLGFWAVFGRCRDCWWAVIPGGLLLTLAVIAGLEPERSGQASGALLFLGLALTFGLVYFVGRPRPRATWALVPASALLVLSLVVLVSGDRWVNHLWPLALVAGGLALLARSLRKAPSDHEVIERLEKNHEEQALPQPH